MVLPGRSNREALHRHALHAFEDFESVRVFITDYNGNKREIEARLHSVSHHLRHAVYRSGLEVEPRKRRYVRRTTA